MSSVEKKASHALLTELFLGDRVNGDAETEVFLKKLCSLYTFVALTWFNCQDKENENN